MHRPVGANRIDGASSDTLIGFLDTQRHEIILLLWRLYIPCRYRKSRFHVLYSFRFFNHGVL
jgi:hypothetical protein